VRRNDRFGPVLVKKKSRNWAFGGEFVLMLGTYSVTELRAARDTIPAGKNREAAVLDVYAAARQPEPVDQKVRRIDAECPNSFGEDV
jgi:hypothetical protein